MDIPNLLSWFFLFIIITILVSFNQQAPTLMRRQDLSRLVLSLLMPATQTWFWMLLPLWEERCFSSRAGIGDLDCWHDCWCRDSVKKSMFKLNFIFSGSCGVTSLKATNLSRLWSKPSGRMPLKTLMLHMKTNNLICSCCLKVRFRV